MFFSKFQNDKSCAENSKAKKKNYQKGYADSVMFFVDDNLDGFNLKITFIPSSFPLLMVQFTWRTP